MHHARTCAPNAGRSLALELVGDADVVIENFRPGTLERWNLGYERLSARSTRASSSRASPGTGRPGPYASAAGFASVAEAMGGLRHINGFPGEPPPRAADLARRLAGRRCSRRRAILAALYRRDALGRRAGPGRRRLADRVVASRCSRAPFPSTTGSASSAGRRAPRLKGLAPSNIFKSRDDKWVVIAANPDGRLPSAVRRHGPARAGRRPALRDPRHARARTRRSSRGSWPAWARELDADRDRPAS